MIRNYSEKEHAENRIKKLERILLSLKTELLPDREEQYMIMAKAYVRKIHELREEIEEFTGMQKFQIKSGDLNIHILGPIIGYGVAPVSLISKYLDDLRKTFQSIYTIIYKEEIDKGMAKKLMSLNEMGLYDYQPGSINLGLQFTNSQMTLFEKDDPLINVIETYFNIIKFVEEDDSGCIRYLDEHKVQKIIQTMIKTMPDNKKISKIGFKSKLIKLEEEVTIDQRCKNKMMQLLTGEDEQLVSVIGYIREIDLDKQSFVLRNIEGRIAQQKCSYNEDMNIEIQSALANRVVVSGIMKKDTLYVITIEMYS